MSRASSLLLVLGFAFCFVLPYTMASPVLGGVSKSDSGSEENQRAAMMVVEKLNSGHFQGTLGDIHGALKLVGIKEVSTQVVAGINYYITMTVQDAAGKQFDVKTQVWARPWLEAKNDPNEPAWQLTHVERLDNDTSA